MSEYVCGLRQRLPEISHVCWKLAAVSGNYFLEDRLYVYKRAVLMKEHIDEFINLLGLFQVGQMFGLRNFGCFDGRIAKCIFLDDLVGCQVPLRRQECKLLLSIFSRPD